MKPLATELREGKAGWSSKMTTLSVVWERVSLPECSETGIVRKKFMHH